MKSDMLIRDATPRELAEIEELVKEAYREFQPLLPQQHWQGWMDNITRTIHSGAGMLLVAEHQGSLWGVVQFFPDATRSGLGHWPRGAAAIRVLAVRPEARGRGIGTLLTEECLRRARSLKIPTIFLYTGEFMQAARHIYEEFGFKRAPEFDRSTGPIAYRLDLES
jgi:ribosomal protein S18 acetylase RimI-like enzyme